MPPILDVAIATVFVFLLFSLVVSALNEYILSLTDQRAKFLRMGLAEIFGKASGALAQQAPADSLPSPGPLIAFWLWLKEMFAAVVNMKATFVRVANWLSGNATYEKLEPMGEDLLKHGLIAAFSRSDNGGTSPSYIPAGAFVTALLDTVANLAPSAAISPTHIAAANSLLSALQAARSTLGSAMQFKDFDQIASNFIASCASLNPASNTPLARLRDRVSEAQADALGNSQQRLQIQTILKPATLATARGLIDEKVPDYLRAELEALLLKSATDAEFQHAIQEWSTLTGYRPDLEAEAAKTMVGLLKDTAEHTGEAIHAGINAINHPELRASLLSLYRSVNGDVKLFTTAVEGWFNGVMDRVTGWYKRYAQNAMIVIAFILAAILNVDTIRIVRELSKNPNLTKALNAQAETMVKSNGFQPTQTWEELKTDIGTKLTTEQKALDDAINAEAKALEAATTKSTEPQPDPETVKAEIEKTRADRTAAQKALDAKKDQLIAEAGNVTEREFHKSIADLKQTGIPLGWDDKTLRKELGLAEIDKQARDKKWLAWLWYNLWAYPVNFFTHLAPFLAMIAGWLLTAVAASLGAPFWFDLLGRFVNIRAAGRPPGEKEPTSTPTRPPLATLDTTRGLTK